MFLRATHTTQYMYSDPVSICHTEVHLAPRAHNRQHVIEHHILVQPEPDFWVSRNDYFGNRVTAFSIYEPHQTLTITSTSMVDVPRAEPLEPGWTPAWEEVRQDVKQTATDRNFEAAQFTFESPHAPRGPEFAEYAARSFEAGRPILEGILDLSHRIHKEFKYDQRATTVSTPVAEVLKKKQGVCQDFAHFMIACLRSLELPARYVSGYLRSGEKSVGTEASHAWVSVYCSGFGWLDIDPTNNVTPDGEHVTVAWGRDYSDVTPVKGVALGGGEQIITVSVEVLPHK